jgi:hypothetical protein
MLPPGRNNDMNVRLLTVIVLIVGTSFLGAAKAAELLLVDHKVSVLPISVDRNAPKEILDAAGELAGYLQKISGAKVKVILNASTNAPAHAIWVGAQPKLEAAFPDMKFDFPHPEEILLACNGQDVVIAGRDRTVGDKPVEHGTVNAVYTFIEKKLDVRWLWPGALGEDIIKRDAIALAPFEYRFHPVFLKRHFWPRNPKPWHLQQRILLYSRQLECGHAFTDWWDKYHETHPEYFALQPNGTRTPPREGSSVKLCLSNPGVWKQWLDNAEQKLRDDPSIIVLSATPNDGPWHCTCESCRAWDHPDAPTSLTERHVKFWNQLGRGLKARFPGRDVYVGAMAYAAYLAPPVAETLEDNIAIAQVGHFPLTSEANREQAKQQWQQWAAKATLMFYRPNLWYWAGGVWGFPEVAMKKTIEDFRFLADNRCTGIIVDVIRNHWATQGPQYYLMAQLAYDPYQDGAAVMKDYYHRGFGPAAADIEAYWTLMEAGRESVVSAPGFKLGSANRFGLPAIFQQVYGEDFMNRADTVLKQAEAKVTASDLHRRRVAYVRAGFDFTRLMVRTIPLMTRIREGRSEATVAEVAQAQANWRAMEQVAKTAEPYAIGHANILGLLKGKAYMGGMQDYFGPPSEELLEGQKEESVQLLPAKWALTFSDDFQRTELGPDWKILNGAWSVENGCLVTAGGGKLGIARKFPGLQKVTFEAVATPNPGVSDVSLFIHAQTGAKELSSGYFLQFGGNHNTSSGIVRKGREVRKARSLIEPGKTHSVIAECLGNTVRLSVDGKVVATYVDPKPLLGADHEQIGFYVYEGIVKISRLKVYTAKAVRKTAEPDNNRAGFE